MLLILHLFKAQEQPSSLIIQCAFRIVSPGLSAGTKDLVIKLTFLDERQALAQKITLLAIQAHLSHPDIGDSDPLMVVLAQLRHKCF